MPAVRALESTAPLVSVTLWSGLALQISTAQQLNASRLPLHIYHGFTNGLTTANVAGRSNVTLFMGEVRANATGKPVAFVMLTALAQTR